MLLIITSTLLTLFGWFSSGPAQNPAGSLKWMTWDEAVNANKLKAKPIFVDVYTDWCGWCKKMDATTFSDPELVNYLNNHFYVVKFNAEQKEEIIWNGNSFKFIGNDKNGAHELALSLMNGRIGYPSTVILDPKFSRILLSPGFKDKNSLFKELKFAKEELYKKISWDEYSKK